MLWRPPASTARPPIAHNLRAVMGDGLSYSVMVGMGEAYIAAFALALALGDIAAGLVATVPLLAGSLLQLVSPWAIRKLGSNRRWVVSCAVIQAGSFLLLYLATWRIPGAAVLVFGAATLYWGAGLATGPAWNTWVEALVPSRIRARYFARRSRLCQMAVLGGFVVAGVALQFGSQTSNVLGVYATIFLAAGLCRFLSAGFLASQSEQPAGSEPPHVGLRETLRNLRRHSGTPLLAYLLAVQVAVQFAGPYFTPFMFSKLGLSYGAYMFLVSMAFLGKFLGLPLMGRLAHQYGARRLLLWCGWGIIPFSALWAASTSYPYLLVIQFAGGFVWSGYELAMFLLFFEAIPKRERTSLLTLYNVGNSAAIACGGLLGGVLLSVMGPSLASYYTLFIISSGLRIFTLPLLAMVRDTRTAVVSDATLAGVAPRTLAVRPAEASIDRPIVATLEEPRLVADEMILGHPATAGPPQPHKPHAPAPVSQDAAAI